MYLFLKITRDGEYRSEHKTEVIGLFDEENYRRIRTEFGFEEGSETLGDLCDYDAIWKFQPVSLNKPLRPLPSSDQMDTEENRARRDEQERLDDIAQSRECHPEPAQIEHSPSSGDEFVEVEE